MAVFVMPDLHCINRTIKYTYTAKLNEFRRSTLNDNNY